MRKRALIITFVVVVAGLWLVGQRAFGARLNASRGLANIFQVASSRNEDMAAEIVRLQEENAKLRAGAAGIDITSDSKIVVFSSYPFNNRSELIIGAGSDQGVTSGDIVTYNNIVLVGKVKQVFADKAIVSTIFDPGFETAVRIGPDQVDALMKGGNELRLELVPAEANVNESDSVITASSDFPYGLEVGKVREIKPDEGNVFRTVTLDPGFEIQSLRYVDFPR